VPLKSCCKISCLVSKELHKKQNCLAKIVPQPEKLERGAALSASGACFQKDLGFRVKLVVPTFLEKEHLAFKAFRGSGMVVWAIS